MIFSLVQLPASARLLSRRGDELCAARGPGLVLRIRRHPTLPHACVVTRGPPSPLFHRRRGLPFRARSALLLRHGVACALGPAVDVAQMPRLCSRAVRSNACKVSRTTCAGTPVGPVAMTPLVRASPSLT